MNFDYEIANDNGAIIYGIIDGNESIVFIKAGAGGSHTGYENKYLHMAHAIHRKDGSTVICASNPSDALSREYDGAVLQQILGARSNPNSKPKIRFIGTSRGAFLGLTELAEHFEFDKLLLINMPLMVNFHKVKKARAISRAVFVFGSADPSVPYIPFIKRHTESITVIQGADHNFKEKTEDFISLYNLL